MIRILIVEASRIGREAFEKKVFSFPNYIVVSSITNEKIAESLCISKNIDLVLMDVGSSGEAPGILAAARIKESCPRVKVILMTSMPEYTFLRRARESGCDSFWYKEDSSISLFEVIERTMRGEGVWPERTPVVMVGQAKSSELTERELAVIRELVQGATYEEIAAVLSISVNTIKFHIKNILQKTSFRNTTRLVADVVEKGLVLPKSC